MPVADILSRLDKVQASRTQGRWLARCPAHEDKHRSFSIVEAGEKGAILLHCFAGCPVDRVLSALNLTLMDLYPEPLGKTLHAQRGRRHFHAAHEVLTMLSHEALVVCIAGENIANGVVLTDDDLKRVWQSSCKIRDAVRAL